VRLGYESRLRDVRDASGVSSTPEEARSKPTLRAKSCHPRSGEALLATRNLADVVPLLKVRLRAYLLRPT
jgi:hypothetical protein